MNNFNLRENWDQKRLKYIFNYSLSSIDRKQKIDEKIVDICHYPNVYNHEKIFGKETLEEGTCTEEEFKSYQYFILISNFISIRFKIIIKYYSLLI